MADETDEKQPEKDPVLSSFPFSHNDRDVIERQLNVSSVRTSSVDSLVDIYEVERTADIIAKHGYKNVREIQM